MVGVPLVVHYWVDLQSVHWFHCYAEHEMLASACTHFMPGFLICIYFILFIYIFNSFLLFVNCRTNSVSFQV